MEKAFFKRISSVIFSSDKTELDIGQKIYYKCLLASRKPEFYTKFEVADTFDGRFDMLCLIISVYMHKLTKEPEKTKEFSQILFDVMFKDIDLTLREMGAGDLGVGKRVKIMSENFMGRLIKYSQSFENKNASLLAKTLARNLYRQEGIVNSDNEITKFVLTLSEEIESLKMDFVMSEEFDINNLVTSCFKLDNE
jgi:cytochrome b pre-mRNA-processing protein 3